MRKRSSGTCEQGKGIQGTGQSMSWHCCCETARRVLELALKLLGDLSRAQVFDDTEQEPDPKVMEKHGKVLRGEAAQSGFTF